MTLAVTWHVLGQTEVIFTTCHIADREEQVTCFKAAGLSLLQKPQKKAFWTQDLMWRLKVVCSKHSQFFCLHAIHLKQLFSWNTFVQFWFPTENQGRSHMTISLRYKRACFQPLNQQNYDLCVLVTLCWSTVPYSSRKVHDNESSYRTTQTQAVINSPIITPCRISWKYMIITIDPKTTRFMSSQPIIMAK